MIMKILIIFVLNKKQLLKNIYLFQQYTFNGKDFDFLIIDNSKDKMNVFIFQVSSNKKKKFDNETLQNSINKMIKYLKQFYDQILKMLFITLVIFSIH